MSDPLYDKIADAKPTTRGNYARPGLSLMRIDKVTRGKKRGTDTTFVVVDMTVLKVYEGPEPFCAQFPEQLARNPAMRQGEQVCVFFDSSGAKADIFADKLKDFVCGVLGLPPNTTDLRGEDYKNVIEGGAFAGVVFVLTSKMIKTPKSKGPFVVHDWGQWCDATRVRQELSDAEIARLYPAAEFPKGFEDALTVFSAA